MLSGVRRRVSLRSRGWLFFGDGGGVFCDLDIFVFYFCDSSAVEL